MAAQVATSVTAIAAVVVPTVSVCYNASRVGKRLDAIEERLDYLEALVEKLCKTTK